MTFDIKRLIKENVKFLIFMLTIIIAGVFGITYALKVAAFSKIGVDIDTSSMDVSITYDTSANNSNVISTGNLLPISDELVTGTNVSDPRVLKVKFYVTGSSSNPANSIYDIAIHDFNVDCDLRSSDVKWRLYKNNTLLSSGNLSLEFDTMSNNRLVLTETQENLTTSSDEYVFLLWISESCTGDLSTCGSEYDQSKYLNKTLSGSIKVEMATKTKKELVRTTSTSASCKYTVTNTPSCNTLIYNGSNQVIINEGTGYSLSGNVGNEVGVYNVTAMVNDGYKWSDGSVRDKVIKCNIDKKDAIVSANSQSIKYGSAISNSYTTSGIIASHSVNNIFLDTDISKVGTGRITPTKAVIVDSNGNDVTSNYDITYNSAALVINCLNTATPPVVSNKNYNGNEQAGISGGDNIKLDGILKAALIGEYSASATPISNYCWSDNSTTKREYTWSIVENAMVVTLSDKSATYTGSAISIDNASITDGSGTSISGPTVTYNYYNGSSCSGSVLSSIPINAGSYSVQAVAGAYQGYKETKSNCATLTINKASSSLTTSLPSSLTYGSSSSVDYTFNTTGSVSCSSSNTNVATCSIDSTNKKVNIVPTGVGSTTITVTGTPSNSNYNSSSVSKTVTVSCSKTATEPSVVTGLTYTGSSQSGLSGGSNVVLGNYSAINVGSYTGTATPKSNYCWSDGTVSTKSYNWAISKATNTLSVTAKTGLTYNGNAQALVTVSESLGTVYYSTGTELTSSNCTSSYCPGGSTSIPTGTNIGTYTVYYYAPESANYQAKSGSVSVTISKKTITPTVTANSKAYDGSSSAVCNVSLSGVYSGDEVSVSSTGSFSSSTAGENKTVTCSNISLSGSDSNNYSLSTTSVSTTATIGYWKNNSNVYYANISNAINGTASGGTITLLYGYTETNAVTLSKNITMNTNGKTLDYGSTMSSNPINISSGGTLNVTGNGTINSDNLRGIVNAGGTFNCTGTTFTGSSVHLYTTSGTSANTSCTFNKESITDSDNAYSVIAISGGTFNMSGGSISGVGYGIYQSGGTVNVSGGTINGSNAYRHIAGTANITGGTLTGNYYGVYSKSGNLNIGTAPSNGTSSNRHTDNKSNKVTPHIEATNSSTSYSGIYIENSVFRMYYGMVKAVGAAFKVSADNTNAIAIDGGSLISTGYVGYYNLSTARTSFTGDAIVIANSNSSAVNTKGTIFLNNDTDMSTTGLNGIQTYYSGCSGDSCAGRSWGTWILSKGGYGIYGNGSAALSVGNNKYTEDATVNTKTYRNQGATICAKSSSFASITDLYWYVGWSFNGGNSYKSNVTNMHLSSVRSYLENYSTTSADCWLGVGNVTYSVAYSYYSYPKTKAEPTGKKVTTNGIMYSFRAENTSCTSHSDCSQNSCNTLGDLPAGKTIWLIEKVSGSSLYYNAWVKVSDFSSSPGAGYNQVAGVNNACSGTTYTTDTINGVKYVKVRIPLKSSSCTNSCCASSCTLS